MKGFAILASATVLTLAVVSSPAYAAVEAQFTPDTNANDYAWIQSAGGTGGHFTSLGTAGPFVACTNCVATHFSFLDPSLSALAFIPTTFQLDATAPEGNPASVNGVGVWAQTGIDGNFKFTYFDSTKAIGSTQTFGGHSLVNGVTNLLSGIFTGAWIQGAGGSGSANVTIANGGHLVLASDELTFNNIDTSTEEFALNLLSATPNFGAAAGQSLHSFVANGGGNFSAVPLAVPEAATWTMMIVGFGGMGAVLRNRRRLAPASV